jgi:hypothetical protein
MINNQYVITELRNLEVKHGILRAEDVVDAARPPDSPLHDRFTWDDTEAARKCRLWEARQLIRAVVEYVEPNNGSNRDELVRVFCSLTPDREETGGGYRSLANVIARPVFRDQLLADALKELKYFQRKYAQYQHLAQFKGLHAVFREVANVINKQSDEKDTHPTESEHVPTE